MGTSKGGKGRLELRMRGRAGGRRSWQGWQGIRGKLKEIRMRKLPRGVHPAGRGVLARTGARSARSRARTRTRSRARPGPARPRRLPITTKQRGANVFARAMRPGAIGTSEGTCSKRNEGPTVELLTSSETSRIEARLPKLLDNSASAACAVRHPLISLH